MHPFLRAAFLSEGKEQSRSLVGHLYSKKYGMEIAVYEYLRQEKCILTHQIK